MNKSEGLNDGSEHSSRVISMGGGNPSRIMKDMNVRPDEKLHLHFEQFFIQQAGAYRK